MYFFKIISTVCSSSIFMVFAIAAIGFLIGAIKIGGLRIGSAGVFLAALVFGHFGVKSGNLPYLSSLLHDIGLVTTATSTITTNMKMVQNIGLALFVTAVGFIAGPKFFGNLKANAKSYVLIAIVIIGLGAGTCAAVVALTPVDSSMAVGILSGALTTTPGFSAAQDAAETKGYTLAETVDEQTLMETYGTADGKEISDYLYNEVTVGHGIGYPFGVLGVVLFVQLVPKILGADMEEERKKFANVSDTAAHTNQGKTWLAIGTYSIFRFALAIAVGVLIGAIYIPLPGGATFSLTTTGGCLLAGLLFGYFGHLGPLDMRVDNGYMVLFREFGLCLFLIGAGVPGGAGFVQTLVEQGWVLFVYGILMTLIPMIAGFFFIKYVTHLGLLNNLGAITGGMTSTPGLGALISTAGTDDVTSAYAATYPVALVFVVVLSQLIVTVM